MDVHDRLILDRIGIMQSNVSTLQGLNAELACILWKKGGTLAQH